jgi:hypothetical protein
MIILREGQSNPVVNNKKLEESELCIPSRKSENCGVFEAVQKWINHKYKDIYSAKDTVIVVGYNVGYPFFEFKKRHPGKRIIMYQLEQLCDYQSPWYNPTSTNKMVIQRTNHVKEWLDNADEIWDYDLDNIAFLEGLGYTTKHVPLEPDYILKHNILPAKKEYDIAFFGSLNEKRKKWLSKLDDKYKLLFVGNPHGFDFKHKHHVVYGKELFQLLAKSKIIINLHYYDCHLQEQVRMFELISNDMVVISQKSKRNYLGVDEFSTFRQCYELIDAHLDLQNTCPEKRVVYTCISNDYEELKEIEQKNPKIDYICFTDNDNLRSDTWEVRKIPEWVFCTCQLSKIQRYIKIMPHLFLDEYDVSLYIDGSMKLVRDIAEMFDAFVNADFVVPYHPYRNCIYDEGDVIIKHKIDEPGIVNRQLNYYKMNDFPPRQGLIQSGFLYRRHNKLRDFSHAWWKEVFFFSHRDQLSFNYAVQDYDLNIRFISPSIICSEFIQIYSHRTAKKVKLQYDKYVNRYKGKEIPYQYTDLLSIEKISTA